MRACCVRGGRRIAAHGITVECGPSEKERSFPPRACSFSSARSREEWLGDVIERRLARDSYCLARTFFATVKRPPSWTLDRRPGIARNNVPGIFVWPMCATVLKRVASEWRRRSVVCSSCTIIGEVQLSERPETKHARKRLWRICAKCLRARTRHPRRSVERPICCPKARNALMKRRHYHAETPEFTVDLEGELRPAEMSAGCGVRLERAGPGILPFSRMKVYG